MKCNNEFCVCHRVNDKSMSSETDCAMYEIDQFDEIENPTGFNINECQAKIRYERMI